MSKAHMIVLGFLNEAPMYGYRIGQIVESKQFSIWAGIKLPSIYKAMQTLQQKGYIAGEQKVEGNNPPRMVYSINSKGKKYLVELLNGFLKGVEENSRDFWLALSFARQLITRKQLKTALEARMKLLSEHLNTDFACKCETLVLEKKVPIIHRHLVKIGERSMRAELETMQELLQQMNEPEYNDFFKE
jgi:DNA-binding PadR family transcriptional regulator